MVLADPIALNVFHFSAVLSLLSDLPLFSGLVAFRRFPRPMQHHAVEGSREELVRYIRAVESEFRIPDERTSTAKLQDWAVGLAWGGSAALAASGMMNIFRREGGRQVDTGTYHAGKLERLRLSGLALQRQRVVAWRNVSFSPSTRAPQHPSCTGRSSPRWSTTARQTRTCCVVTRQVNERSTSSTRASNRSATHSG